MVLHYSTRELLIQIGNRREYHTVFDKTVIEGKFSAYSLPSATCVVSISWWSKVIHRRVCR